VRLPKEIRVQRLFRVIGLVALLLSLAACSAGATRTTAAPTGQSETRIATLWSASCALCHVDGKGGAPRVGHADEWQPRLAKGPEVLLQHTLEGFNDMPPLGYCMACERADFEALIRFMAESG
jgi:cytochrome c5